MRFGKTKSMPMVMPNGCIRIVQLYEPTGRAVWNLYVNGKARAIPGEAIELKGKLHFVPRNESDIAAIMKYQPKRSRLPTAFTKKEYIANQEFLEGNRIQRVAELEKEHGAFVMHKGVERRAYYTLNGGNRASILLSGDRVYGRVRNGVFYAEKRV